MTRRGAVFVGAWSIASVGSWFIAYIAACRFDFPWGIVVFAGLLALGQGALADFSRSRALWAIVTATAVACGAVLAPLGTLLLATALGAVVRSLGWGGAVGRDPVTDAVGYFAGLLTAATIGLLVGTVQYFAAARIPTELPPLVPWLVANAAGGALIGLAIFFLFACVAGMGWLAVFPAAHGVLTGAAALRIFPERKPAPAVRS